MKFHINIDIYLNLMSNQYNVSMSREINDLMLILQQIMLLKIIIEVNKSIMNSRLRSHLLFFI